MNGYMGGSGGETRPAPVLIVLMLIGGSILYLSSLNSPQDSPAAQSAVTQVASMGATPTPAAPTPNAAMIQPYVVATVTVMAGELRIAERTAEAGQTQADAAATISAAQSEGAIAEVTKSAAQAEGARSIATQVYGAQIQERLDQEKEARERREAETLQNTLITYAILILAAASACGIFIMAVGWTIRRLLQARRRRDEAAYRLLIAELKLRKNNSPLRDREKSYTDQPTVGHPHPLEDGSVKEPGRTTKGRPAPDQEVQEQEKRRKAYPPGVDD